jgi:hypothetical protein
MTVLVHFTRAKWDEGRSSGNESRLGYVKDT